MTAPFRQSRASDLAANQLREQDDLPRGVWLWVAAALSAPFVASLIGGAA